ncbi:MAG: hypothetical protein SLRJCFUN_000375, partial [Candidatus Fervidibacter sp.]
MCRLNVPRLVFTLLQPSLRLPVKELAGYFQSALADFVKV